MVVVKYPLLKVFPLGLISGTSGLSQIWKLLWRYNMSFPILIKASLIPNLEADKCWPLKYSIVERIWFLYGFLNLDFWEAWAVILASKIKDYEIFHRLLIFLDLCFLVYKKVIKILHRAVLRSKLDNVSQHQ